MTRPWNLDYWRSGEWQVCDERLRDLTKSGVGFNPVRAHLFSNLASLSCSDVKVAIIGQDPYPQHGYATGHAFSIPEHYSQAEFPATLREIFAEYGRDLGYEVPCNGNLKRWVDQGVLLWNVIPSTTDGLSLSHDWVEYEGLSREVLGRLSDKGGVVFVFLGRVAARYIGSVDTDLDQNKVITTSHPSPRGSRNSRMPFNGSRLFSTINLRLVELGQDPIDWRLDDGGRISNIRSPEVDRGRTLDNITGADLGRQSRPIAPNTYTVKEFQ